MVLAGTVTSVDWGRVESGRDTLYVDTRTSRWVGHLGDTVAIDAPRLRRFTIGETVWVVGRFDGVVADAGSAGQPSAIPSITAVGVRIAGP